MADKSDLSTEGAITAPEPKTDSGVAPATTFSTSGAPVQIVPDVDADHPAVDNDPRKNTTALMNRIDFNDPTLTGPEAVAKNLADQAKG
jgi:hypothetical protein